MDNEPELPWNEEMHSLAQGMIHYRNGLESGTECDPSEVSGFESRYHEILKNAEEEAINENNSRPCHSGVSKASKPSANA